jgi:hypothetical protein
MLVAPTLPPGRNTDGPDGAACPGRSTAGPEGAVIPGRSKAGPEGALIVGTSPILARIFCK